MGLKFRKNVIDFNLLLIYYFFIKLQKSNELKKLIFTIFEKRKSTLKIKLFKYLQVSWLCVESGVYGGGIDERGDDTIVAGKRELMIERLHHADLRKLGRTIVRHVAKAEQTRTTSNADYMAMISTKHARQELFENPIAGEQIHAHHRHEVVLFALHKRPKRLDRSVVDYDCHIADIAVNAFAHGRDLLSTPTDPN